MGTATFYRALNLNGAALTIDGNNWISSIGAANFSFTGSNGAFSDQGVPLIPATDANRSTMIRSSIWGAALNLAVSAVPAGNYQVWLYVWEDNNAETYSISLEGTVVLANYNSGATGAWSKLGPFQATINDGTINVSAAGGAANISGIEIWSAGAPGGNQPPVVANVIPDQTATEGTAYNFTFASNTFSDPNAGTVLTYTASLSGGGALPAWLTFTGGTRTFSGTPAIANVGVIDVRVTAADGAGGTVSDVFSLTVNPIVKVTPVITWANPAAITAGIALSAVQLNATATHNGNPVAGTFTYTPVAGTVLAEGLGQQLSVNFVPTNANLYNPATQAVTIDVLPAVKVTPVITWANPAAITFGTALSAVQLNATASYNGSPVAGTFTYTPTAGTILPVGTGQLLSVGFVPTNTTLYETPAASTVTIDVNAAPTASFYRALNLNGAALTIDGNNWISSIGAANFSFTGSNGAFSDQGVPLIPATDANRSTMIRSSIWGTALNLAVGAIPAGNYQVWLYVWEDNNAETYSISLEGAVVRANYNSGPTGTWSKLGPYPVTINDGVINISAAGGAANISGIEIWSAGAPNQPPVVANVIPDQTATEGTAYNFTFASNTFSDPNAGTVLTYTASLSGGGALPAWLTFTGGTRTFSGTPAIANVGVIDVRVTAADGAGGTVSDVFSLTVNPIVKVTPVITWANPAAITAGIALSAVQLNATATHNGNPVAGTFTYTPVAGTVLAEGLGQQLSVNFVPTNASLYNPATQAVTIDVLPAVKVTPVITWANPAAITLGTALSAVQLNATASYNGSPVAGTFTYTPVSGTVLAEGLGQQLSVDFVPTNATLYNPATRAVTIDVLPKAIPVITWANPAAITFGTALSAVQLNATASYNGSPVAGTFTYTPTAGTILPVGTGQLLSVGFVPTNTTLYETPAASTVTIDVNAAPTASFYRALNLNGAALTIDGNNWISSIGAANFSYTGSIGAFASQGVPLIPATDANRSTMIRSSIWGFGLNLAVSAIPAGNYQVWLYVWEDNNAETYSISLEGTVVRANYNSGPTGTWSKLGPYPVTINDGVH